MSAIAGYHKNSEKARIRKIANLNGKRAVLQTWELLPEALWFDLPYVYGLRRRVDQAETRLRNGL